LFVDWIFSERICHRVGRRWGAISVFVESVMMPWGLGSASLSVTLLPRDHTQWQSWWSYQSRLCITHSGCFSIISVAGTADFYNDVTSTCITHVHCYSDVHREWENGDSLVFFLNFVKYWLIFEIMSPADSAVNL